MLLIAHQRDQRRRVPVHQQPEQSEESPPLTVVQVSQLCVGLAYHFIDALKRLSLQQ